MNRGFLICHTSLLCDKETLGELYPEEFYTVYKANNYLVISAKSSGSVGAPDFFKIPFDSNLQIFVYGYITYPLKIDSRTANKEGKLTTEISHNRNMHYFINKSNDLNGSFTLIRISIDDEIVIFTDRLGTRPVYYSQLNGQWVVSSSGSLLLPLRKMHSKIKPNFIAFSSLVLRSRPVDRLTLVEDVYRSDAGEIIRLVPYETEKRNKWFTPKYDTKSGVSLTEKVEELEGCLEKSASNLSAITLKPLLFLSGGMDSRLAAAILNDKMDGLEAMTLCDTLNSEAKIAKRVATEIGLKHNFYFRDRYYYLKNLEKLVTSCLGSYFYVHGHFSFALEENPYYEDVYLGDFLESIKKLLGFKTNIDQLIKRPEDIVANIFLIDDYSSGLEWETFKIFNNKDGEQVRDEYTKMLLQEAREAFEVADETALIVDYYLRWRRAYEISTFGMFEDIRLVRSDKNLAWDNDFISFLLKLNTAERTRAKLGVRLLKRRNRNLIMKIPDANTLIPPGYPNFLKTLTKNIRKVGGLVRRQFLYTIGRPPISGMHSWQNADQLNVSDQIWKEYLHKHVISDVIFETNEFNADFVRLAWERYCQYDFRYSYIVYALLNYSILFQ